MTYAIVTGAASGIGRATSFRLAHDGHALVAVDVDGAGVETTAQAVREFGGAADAVVLDVSDGGAVARALAQLVDDRGAPSVVVNNAGIGVAATVMETDTEQWQRILDVNLGGTFHVCRAVLPPMIGTGRGVIVNVSSVAGLVGVARRAAYCASKAAVLGLTRAIAVDHAREGVRANAICPGTVATEWVDKILAGADDPEALRRSMEQRQLNGRMGTPEEVASGIAFLASEEASFVNGAVFVMDGGMTAV